MMSPRSSSIPRAAVALLLSAGCENPSFSTPHLSEHSQSVVQGRPAEIADFPATVALLDTQRDDVVFCTGSVLDARHVLTAAHCVANLRNNPSRIDVLAGYADTNTAPESARFEVAELAVHPEWTGFPRNGDPDGLDVTNDVAVLTLARPVSSPRVVRLLPDDRIAVDLVPGAKLEIVGFGEDDAGARGVLRRGTAPIRKRTEQLLLIGELGSADSCEYDSGGPVYLLAKDGVFLVGITSREWPGAKSLRCGEGGVYTMPMAYRAFIEEAVPLPPPDTAGGGDDAGAKGDAAIAGADASRGGRDAGSEDHGAETEESRGGTGCAIACGRAASTPWLLASWACAILSRSRRRRPAHV